MKKTISFALCALILLSLPALPGFGQTAQDALAKMINAMGGKKALGAIKDTTISGSVELAQLGLTASITMYQKEPDKLRIDMGLLDMVIAMGYDGRKGWFTDPQSGTTQEMPESQSRDLSRQALGNAALLDPQKLGITFALKPKEKIEGKEYIVLEQILADGHSIAFFLDPATYLPFKAKTRAMGQSGAEVEAETYFSDYRKIENTMVAHSIRTLQDGVEAQKVTIVKVVYNSNLDDPLFRMR